MTGRETIIAAGGTAVRAIVARVALIAGLSLPALAFGSGTVLAQADWARKAFGLPTSSTSLDRPASNRGPSAEVPLDDLRTGDIPLRSREMLEALDLAYGRYKAIAQRGGWPNIPTTRLIRPGDDDERIPIVRRRLRATGELSASADLNSFNFDGVLESAVRAFQKRHGLTASGRIDRSTITAMNVPVQARLNQIKLNYDRLAQFIDRGGTHEDRYIVVNSPGYQLEAVEGGRVALRHRVIAGRPGRDTPVVTAAVRALNFFPYWRVPDSIALLDLAPRLQKEPDYLAKEHIRILSGNFNGPEVDPATVNWTQFDPKLLKFRQDPGQQNALGLVRLDMPNEHGVYMHDTPMKPLFARAQRAFSAGCVRVQDVFDLATWIAKGEPGMDRARVDEIIAAGTPVDITLARPVPVHFIYVTAWADQKGHADFRPDIYGLDGLDELRTDRDPDPDAPPPPPQSLAP
jgi:murein L,D-transpeptidase YcbB/YkuD